MNKEIKTKMNNVIKAECDYVMKNEKNKNAKLEKMDTLFNLKKIIDNYDDLKPMLTEFFAKKTEREKWER